MNINKTMVTNIRNVTYNIIELITEEGKHEDANEGVMRLIMLISFSAVTLQEGILSIKTKNIEEFEDEVNFLINGMSEGVLALHKESSTDNDKYITNELSDYIQSMKMICEHTLKNPDCVLEIKKSNKLIKKRKDENHDA